MNVKEVTKLLNEGTDNQELISDLLHIITSVVVAVSMDKETWEDWMTFAHECAKEAVPAIH